MLTSPLTGTAARGATFLILLQVASRAITFCVNQVLLRYLSPSILGVASQLDLFSISTLYFSRESIRVTLQRNRHQQESPGQTAHEVDGKSDGKELKNGRAATVRMAHPAQNAINLSYVAILLGILLTLVFRSLYLARADPHVLQTPFIRLSLNMYALAIIFELLHEPFFALAQLRMAYGLRASAEMAATFSRCLVVCGMAIFASRQRHSSTSIFVNGAGVLPFAAGQLAYAAVLMGSYAIRLFPYEPAAVAGRTRPLRLIPRPAWPFNITRPHVLVNDKASGATASKMLSPSSAQIKLAATLYGQSIFKQLLTSGDAYMIALLTPLSSQGSYTLATNYGSLFARILFQPIEESSRAFFARLLNGGLSRSLQAAKPVSSPDQAQPPASLLAQSYLTTILRLYSILGLFFISIAPPLAAPLLTLLIGPRWSGATSIDSPARVLATYCYYIPVLALNGILEAYVAAVASPAQLRTQSAYMLAFSAIFGILGYILLGLFDRGAVGLVIVNTIVMCARISWSWRFVRLDLAGRRSEGTPPLSLTNTLPRLASVAAALGGRAILDALVMLDADLAGRLDRHALAKAIAVGVLVVSLVLGFERQFLLQSWRRYSA